MTGWARLTIFVAQGENGPSKIPGTISMNLNYWQLSWHYNILQARRGISPSEIILITQQQ
jgi:hypothetical protein